MAQGYGLGQVIADESRCVLDGYVLLGAREMLQRALECEVEAFLAEHADRVDEHGRKQVGVRTPQPILTGQIASRVDLVHPILREAGYGSAGESAESGGVATAAAAV